MVWSSCDKRPDFVLLSDLGFSFPASRKEILQLLGQLQGIGRSWHALRMLGGVERAWVLKLRWLGSDPAPSLYAV